MILEAALVGTGGFVGALARVMVSRRVTRGAFPMGVLVVNILGSAIAGGVVAGAESRLTLLVAVGFAGSFTTFSSFAYHAVALVEQGRHRQALLHLVGNLILALLAAGLGWWAVALIGT